MSLYNDIAIILRESLKNTPYLIPIVETFSRYFNEKDGKFSKRQFKSACFNGKKMENTKSGAHALWGYKMCQFGTRKPLGNWNGHT